MKWFAKSNKRNQAIEKLIAFNSLIRRYDREALILLAHDNRIEAQRRLTAASRLIRWSKRIQKVLWPKV